MHLCNTPPYTDTGSAEDIGFPDQRDSRDEIIGDMFRALDVDWNGKTARTEMLTAILSEVEHNPEIVDLAGEMFDRADADKDGKPHPDQPHLSASGSVLPRVNRIMSVIGAVGTLVLWHVVAAETVGRARSGRHRVRLNVSQSSVRRVGLLDARICLLGSRRSVSVDMKLVARVSRAIWGS